MRLYTRANSGAEKGAFNYVARKQLLKRMIQLKIPGDLIQWTNSFLTDRQIQLVIDGHTCPAASLETEVPQGSPVSPILFIIYLSGIFEVIEAKVPIKALSFVDDIGLLTSGNLIQKVSEILETAEKEAISWGLANNVSFEVNKTKAVLFTKKKGRLLRQSLSRAKITLDGRTITYN
jgi:hypothetical protein